jgi:HemY protein
VRAILWLLLLGTLAVTLSIAARYNDGYVLFVVSPWRAELSLNLFVLIAVLLFFVGYAFLRVVRRTLDLPGEVAEFRLRRARDRVAVDLQEANRLLIEGRYGHALRSAERLWPLLEPSEYAKGLTALIGLRAAHALRDEPRQALWRERLSVSGERTEAARWMTEAELALADRRFEVAREALQTLARSGRQHIAALRLRLRVEQGLGNWQEVARLVRKLEKARALTAAQAEPLRRRAVRECVRALRTDPPSLQRYWRDLEEGDRAAPAIALEAARAFAAAGDCREAQRVIEDALEENWDSELVLAYADCYGGDVLGRIARAEKWLQLHPRDEALLLSLGRLCRERQLWGKARSFYEASLALMPTRAAHVALAQLLDELQESALATRHYREAALLD